MAPQNGSRILVTVDRMAGEVEWTQQHPVIQLIAKERIPSGMRAKTLLPVVHLRCNYNNVVRFL